MSHRLCITNLKYIINAFCGKCEKQVVSGILRCGSCINFLISVNIRFNKEYFFYNFYMICLSTCMPIFVYYRSTSLQIYFFVCLPLYLCTWLPIYMPICLPAILSTYLPAYLSAYLSVYKSTFLPVYVNYIV